MFLIKKKFKRTIFIGDVHGCLDELLELIKKLSINKKDRVIFLGDLINKGPYSQETVEFVYKKKYQSIMGNHEWLYLKKVKKKKIAKKKYHYWIASRPIYIEDSHFIIVHAGLPPDFESFKKADKKLFLTIRYWYHGKSNKYQGIPWHSFYKGKKTIFYGHWARQGFHQTGNTIGLDTGCVYGKKLSAYILEEKKLVQIKAKKNYASFSKK